MFCRTSCSLSTLSLLRVEVVFAVAGEDVHLVLLCLDQFQQRVGEQLLALERRCICGRRPIICAIWSSCSNSAISALLTNLCFPVVVEDQDVLVRAEFVLRLRVPARG